MARFIMADEDLNDLFRIQDYKSLITAETTACTIEALSKEAGLEEGFRSIYASVDEVHQHRDGSIYRAIYRGQRALRETLLSMITTRGSDLSSFCFEMDSYCVSILEGGATAEDFFCDIYTLDKEDNIFDPACFLKSNPVLCQTDHGMEVMLTDAKTAQEMGGSELRDYMVKCQNMWAENQDDLLMDANMIEACRDKRTIADFRGCKAYAGLDLSSGGDLTTIVLELEIAPGEYFLWSHSFMPRGRLLEHLKTDLAPYDLWERMELLTVTGGEGDYKNNYGFILNVLRETLAQYDIQLLGIGYDPHNADAFLADLDQFGVPLLCVTQSARYLYDATVDIQLLAKSGKYHFSRRDELVDWSFRNARLVENSFGEKKVDKNPRARGKRIDPVDAAIDARKTRMKLGGVPTVDLEAAMKQYMEKMGWKPEATQPG
jgi:phage terminase large subunit-like protein